TNLTRIFVFLFGFLIIFNSLGISITPILTGLGIGGLAVALALQETLANLFAGLQLIASKQIRPGDYIRLGSGEEGFIVDINWRNTTVRELSNNLNIIPNSHISKTIVKNYFLPEKISSVLVQVGVAYESDLEKVEKATIEVAREVMREIPGGVSDFEPFTRYHTFGDSSINFTVILKAKEFVDQYILKHEFIKRLHKRYQAEGITIPFPIRTLHFEGKVPESVLKDME
ncbi:MAG: mechanosensitive ion channel family protein, partial [Acidobacteria bacterium]|nr:mechanosensitive ion channel family protein [Acidobacteriota bacterium]